METVAPTREKRRGCRWLLWTAGVLLALPFVIFGLSNLLLCSSWGRARIERKIQAITGQEAHVGGASWSPWNGASLYSVEIPQPQPLRPYIRQPMVSAQRLNITPAWKAWLRGTRSISSITMESPRLVLAVEAISSAIQVPGEIGIPAPAQASTSFAEGPPPLTPPVGTTPRGPDIRIASSTIPDFPPDERSPQITSIPTSWLNVRNASFQLVSAQAGKTLLEVSHISGRVPFSGNPATSTLQVGKLAFMEQMQPQPLNLEFSWNRPVLALSRLEIPLGTQKVLFAAKVAKLPGIPMELQLQAPTQPLVKIPLPRVSQIEAESIRLEGRFLGALAAPATWSGDFLAEVKGLHGTLGGREFSFDEGQALTLLRGHVLSCLDARLVGEEISLLGNATLLADGRAAGVMRFVATPESIQAITNHFFPGINPPPVTSPLGTPQRVAFDLHTFGKIGDMSLQLGQDGPLVRMNTTPSSP